METSTPNQKSKSSSKRELSSPLDAAEIKKSKASDSLNGSAISVGNEQTTNLWKPTVYIEPARYIL